MGGFLPPRASAGGSGIPGASVILWCEIEPLAGIITNQGGGVTIGMFTRHGGGQYVFDFSSLLSDGVYAMWVQPVANFNQAGGNAVSFSNSTFNGNFQPGSGAKKIGILLWQYNGSAWVNVDQEFSLLILGK